ncbi:MAG: pilus assembly protein [Anaerolineae bacterium]|nr:pilus assembly protein [Anaerolineae bacterium]
MKLQPRGRQEGGQTTVEFALVISVLLLVVFGIMDFSRLMFAYATMSNGVREGARYAVIHPGPDHEAEIVARAHGMMVVLGGTANVMVAYPDGDLEGGPYCSHLCRVVVRATSDFDAWTPIIPAFQIEARATMHLE